jgi:predicted amidohydrolase YtcJ
MIPNPSAPDLILLNGLIRTMDIQRPRARAMAVKAGRITAVGENDEIRALAGSETTAINLNQRLVIPGLMDSHFHFYDWAMGRKQLNLAQVKSLDEVLKQVARAAGELPQGNWILGQGWNESEWPEHIMPGRDHLDSVTAAHPVALWRCDLHLVSVNSRALELAGIDATTPNPPDGVIEKDSSGRPTGILRELAPNLIKAVIPAPSADKIVAAMRAGISHLHTLGLTGIHDVRLMGGWRVHPL